MRAALLSAFKRYEMYVVTTIIGVVFVAAMAIVAWMLRGSLMAHPYEALSDADLKGVHATAYLRYREDDGEAYLKVELHNGTMWWIKKVEFEFDGLPYMVKDSDAFRPLYLGAVRCTLKKAPSSAASREFDLIISKAFGYPPADLRWQERSKQLARDPLSVPSQH